MKKKLIDLDVICSSHYIRFIIEHYRNYFCLKCKRIHKFPKKSSHGFFIWKRHQKYIDLSRTELNEYDKEQIRKIHRKECLEYE